MADPATRNVFVSHIHEDDAGLSDLKSLLSKNGMEFRDYSINSSNPNNARSEEYIKSEILAPRIRACSAMIVYITPETKDSEYVAWEIEYARALGIPIVGVWEQGCKGCEVPAALIEFGDAVVGWHGNSIIDAINGKARPFETADGKPFPVQEIRRYGCAS